MDGGAWWATSPWGHRVGHYRVTNFHFQTRCDHLAQRLRSPPVLFNLEMFVKLGFLLFGSCV